MYVKTRSNNMVIGGALVKWPKYFFPPIPTKFGDIIKIALLVNIPNFEAKKLTGRSPLTMFPIKNVILPVKWGLSLKHTKLKWQLCQKN
jgi:hypothetical protein